MPFDFSLTEYALIAVIFIWTGFVRSGLGFGGAALGLPLMLFVLDQPLYWLPIIGLHLLFFSAITLRTRFRNVDWAFLQQSSYFIIPAALIGVFGLLNLPNDLLVILIYSFTLFFAVIWVFNFSLQSTHAWVDKVLLVFGGYVAGTSLTGAPLMVAVAMRNVSAAQLRNTLFVLWFVLVFIKLAAFVAFNVSLQWLSALLVLPFAAIGHVLGLKAHEFILRNDAMFRRATGGVLALISVLGLIAETV